MAFLKVDRDYGVVFLDLKLAGLREAEGAPARYAQTLEAIQQDLVKIMPKLKDMYTLDVALEDTAGRRFVARFYTYGGIVYYAVLISEKNKLGSLLRKLTAHGWRLLVLIEKKAVKKNETDVR